MAARERVHGSDHLLKRAQLLSTRQLVRLVEHKDVCRLHLLDKQLDHLALHVRDAVVLAELGLLDDPTRRVKEVDKRGRVDHRHERLELHLLHQLLSRLDGTLEGGAHLVWLGNAGRLDDNVVVRNAARLSKLNKLVDCLHELFSGRAARAPVLQLDGVGRRAAAATHTLHQLGINVDGRDVVDNDADLQTLLILEHVAQQRRLPCSEEAREQGDWSLRPHRPGLRHFATPSSAGKGSRCERIFRVE